MMRSKNAERDREKKLPKKEKRTKKEESIKNSHASDDSITNRPIDEEIQRRSEKIVSKNDLCKSNEDAKEERG